MKWISVEDRLPDCKNNKGVYVLCYDGAFVGDLVQYHIEHGFRVYSTFGWVTIKPSHWMPIPEPPKQ